MHSSPFGNWRSAAGLALRFALRDLRTVYSRSVAGYAWLVFTPLALLGIYWTVFSFHLGVSWPTAGLIKPVGYAFPFFCGLSIYLAVADAMSGAVSQFSNKRTYVAKVAFPLWAIPVASWLRSVIVAVPSITMVTLLSFFYWPNLSWASITAIFCIASALMMTLGLSFLLSSIGAFFGDLQHSLQIIVRVLFYASPISYPISTLSSHSQHWILINPIAAHAEWLRQTLIYGQLASFEVVGAALAGSLVLLSLGTWIFYRVRQRIADVV